MNTLFISGWPEITKNGFLLLSLKSKTLWVEPAVHHLLGHIVTKDQASSICPVGFISEGNTCYDHSTLQILKAMLLLWNRVPSESDYLFPMLQAISLKMAVKKKSTRPADPLNFLWVSNRIVKRKYSNFWL